MAAEEVKYFDRLNIPVLSISKIKDLIKEDIIDTIKAWIEGIEVERQCFHIIGPAGVGKTAICKQIQDELTEQLKKEFKMIMVKSPVLSRDDFIIPFPVMGEGEETFKMLYSDFVPKGKESFGLFVIDECSRGDHSLQQLFWQVQNEYKVHLLDFPKGWFVITTDNPDDSEYQMDTMEDAAGLRRQLHIYTEVSVPDFLNYANSAGFHPSIIEFISTHPDFLYDFESQKVGAVFANPASYEKLSNHLIKMDPKMKSDFSARHLERIDTLAAGLLNTNKASLFIEFLTEGKDINPRDIFYDYPKVQKRINELIRNKDNAGLSKVMMSFTNYLTGTKPEIKSSDKREHKFVATFLSQMPLDMAAIFITTIDKFDRKTEEFKYMTRLHVDLNNNYPEYKTKFYEAVVRVGKGDS